MFIGFFSLVHAPLFKSQSYVSNFTSSSFPTGKNVMWSLLLGEGGGEGRLFLVIPCM